MPRPIRAPTKSLGGAASLKTLNRTTKTAPPVRNQTKESLLSTEPSHKATTTRLTRSTRATRSTDLRNVSSENVNASEEIGNTRRPTKTSSTFSVEIPINRNANRLNQQRDSSSLRRTTGLRSKGDVSPRKSSPLKTSPVKTRMVSLEEATQESQQSVVPETPPKKRRVSENGYIESSPVPSSEQENRSPSPRSSPPLNEPLGVSTPLQTASVGRLMRFRSDEGFTPPPPSRRLPLQEVRLRKDRSPIRIPDTPSRTSTQRSRNIWSETDTCGSTPPSGQAQPGASPFFPRRFTPASFEVFEDDTATKTPQHRRGTKRDSNGAAKTPSPVQSKDAPPISISRPGSEASEGSDTVIATPAPAVIKRTRAVATATNKAAVMPTAALQALLPRKREPTKKKIIKRVIIDSEGNSQEVFSQSSDEDDEDIYELNVESDEDELSSRKTIRKGKATAAPKNGRKAAVTKKSTKAKPTTKTANVKKSGSKDFQPVLPKRFNARTYGRKALEDAEKKQGEMQEDVEESGDQENRAPEKSQRTKSIENVVQKVREHFKEVDSWELDFETVSSAE